MSKRKRLTGKAAEMEQVAQVLRQNDIPVQLIRVALLTMCGLQVKGGEVGDVLAWREHLLRPEAES